MLSGNALLAIAIAAEVVATTALKASDALTRPWFAALALVGYLIAFTALAIALRTIPLGIAYALWSGLGIVMITLLGFALFGQRLDLPAYIGIGLILAGVVSINLWSRVSVVSP